MSEKFDPECKAQRKARRNQYKIKHSPTKCNGTILYLRKFIIQNEFIIHCFIVEKIFYCFSTKNVYSFSIQTTLGPQIVRTNNITVFLNVGNVVNTNSYIPDLQRLNKCNPSKLCIAAMKEYHRIINL